MTRVTKADLDKANDALFDARNLIGAIQMAAENIKDENREIIQTLTRLAVEKIDDVLVEGVFDSPPTKKEMAMARAFLEKKPA
jgi:hypothetical protein